MKKWMILIILLALFTSLETIGQVSVISVSKPSGKPSGTGMYYTLPRTTLRVDVELKSLDGIEDLCRIMQKNFLVLLMQSNLMIPCTSLVTFQLHHCRNPILRRSITSN